MKPRVFFLTLNVTSLTNLNMFNIEAAEISNFSRDELQFPDQHCKSPVRYEPIEYWLGSVLHPKNQKQAPLGLGKVAKVCTTRGITNQDSIFVDPIYYMPEFWGSNPRHEEGCSHKEESIERD